MAYDRFLVQERSPLVDRWIRLLKLNQGMEIHKIIPCSRDENIVDDFWTLVDTDRFRQKDREYVKLVFSLTGMALGNAVMETLSDPEHQELFRQDLEQRLEIVRRGCLTAPDEGETL